MREGLAGLKMLGLAHFESDRFQQRLKRALGIVGAALRQARRPYVSFSGGKDSTAVCALVHALAPDVPLLWSDAELELPETVEYLQALKRVAGEQLVLVQSRSTHAGWFRSWEDPPFFREPLPGTLRIPRAENPLPGQSAKDDYMASQGYDLVFLGLRRNENRRRRDWLIQAGETYRVRTGCGLRCSPIAEWTEDDVWALIYGWGLGYNPAYDRMAEIGIDRQRQRVGPLPLAPREQLAGGWPELLSRLEERYQRRWSD